MDQRSYSSSILVPWKNSPEGWCAWGIPIDPIWWQKEGKSSTSRLQELRKLADYHPDLDAGPGCMAALIAAALAELREWELCGIPIAGKEWADLGGGNGYYSIALRLLGAKSVLLVDEDLPSPWAMPLLSANGVEVAQADATDYPLATENAALLLGVAQSVEFVTQFNQDLQTVICTPLSVKEIKQLRRKQWEVDEIHPRMGYVAMSDCCAYPGYSHPDETKTLFVCKNTLSASQRRVADAKVADSIYQSEGNEASADDNIPF